MGPRVQKRRRECQCVASQASTIVTPATPSPRRVAEIPDLSRVLASSTIYPSSPSSTLAAAGDKLFRDRSPAPLHWNAILSVGPNRSCPSFQVEPRELMWYPDSYFPFSSLFSTWRTGCTTSSPKAAMKATKIKIYIKGILKITEDSNTTLWKLLFILSQICRVYCTVMDVSGCPAGNLSCILYLVEQM